MNLLPGEQIAPRLDFSEVLERVKIASESRKASEPTQEQISQVVESEAYKLFTSYLRPLKLSIPKVDVSYETIQIDAGNKPAVDLMSKWKIEDTYGFFLTGAAGSGKTTLLTCAYLQIVNQLVRMHRLEIKHDIDTTGTVRDVRSKTFVWQNAIDMLANIKSGFDTNKNEMVLNSYRRADYLFIDDLGSENITDWSREQFYRIVDFRVRFEIPTFVSTNLKMDEFKKNYHERLSSRIKHNCLVLDLTGTDRRNQIYEKRMRELKNREQEKK